MKIESYSTSGKSTLLCLPRDQPTALHYSISEREGREEDYLMLPSRFRKQYHLTLVPVPREEQLLWHTHNTILNYTLKVSVSFNISRSLPSLPLAVHALRARNTYFTDALAVSLQFFMSAFVQAHKAGLLGLSHQTIAVQ